MKELAQALKQRAGLRRRQGVVTAVTEPTVSVLIGGSSVAVDGVQHLNSCAPQIGDVVWLDVDGADLWIIGTHGNPPPIDPSRMPAIIGSTITGGVLQTGATGQRVEIAGSTKSIHLFSGVAGEVLPAGIYTAPISGGAVLDIEGPLLAVGGPQARIVLTDTASGSLISLIADQVGVEGDLAVDGSIKPSTDWGTQSSDDGIWVQDRNTPANRYKLAYDSASKRLSISDASTNVTVLMA